MNAAVKHVHNNLMKESEAGEDTILHLHTVPLTHLVMLLIYTLISEQIVDSN